MMHETNLLVRLHALLQESLTLWAVQDVDVVAPQPDQLELRAAHGLTICIAPTPQGLREVARWAVMASDGTSRVCSSSLGVLALVRELLGATPQQSVPLRLAVTGATA